MPIDASTSPAGDLSALIAPVVTAINSDGFGVEWTIEGRAVSVVVTADEAACRECLVPAPVLAAMFTQALDGSGYDLVSLQTPAGT